MERDQYTFQELAEFISSLPHVHAQRIIAIDGLGGVGKKTFAENLHKALVHSAIVHSIDFRKMEKDRVTGTDFVVSPNIDWDRFDEEIFTPLRFGRQVMYHKYDSFRDAINEEARIALDAVIIVEGEYVAQDRFSALYDLKIWIDMPDSIRLTRILESDGELVWKQWQQEERVIEQNYVEKQKQHLRADVVVNGKHADFHAGTYTILKQ